MFPTKRNKMSENFKQKIAVKIQKGDFYECQRIYF